MRPARCAVRYERRLCCSSGPPPQLTKSSHATTQSVNTSDEILKTETLCYREGVTDLSDAPVNRLERRKQRTRAALIRAAQAFIAEGKVNVPVLEITQAADVGMGSFYNHFASKEELFEAAVADVLDAHGALLDRLTESIDDPAETFACSFRLTCRLFRRRPQESRILLVSGLNLMPSDRGLGRRALRGSTAAAAAGRFTVDDPKLAMAVAAGALFGLGKLLQDEL